MRAHATALAIAVVAAVPAPARAQGEVPPDQRVLVVALTGEASGPHAGLPERLSGSLAGVIGQSGAQVTRASIDDVLGLAGCGEASDECLQQALDILEVGRVVLGEVDASSGQVQVRLRLIAAGRPARSRTLSLTGGDQAALDRQFRAAAAAFWRDPDGAPTPADAAAASPAGRAAPAVTTSSAAPGEARARFSARRVSRLAWGIAGGGAGVAAVGGLLLVAAANKQGQVDDAPTASAQDLERLVELERSGRNYSRWGSALLVVGAVTAGAGGAFIFKQGSEASRDEEASAPPGSSLALLPSLVTRGGLGVTLTLRVRR
jgi:hypothetical protein